MRIELSDRLKKLPPYLFVEIDRKKKAALEEGRDIIDLGIGDPDQPTPKYVIDALNQAANDPSTHRYALDAGLPELKNRIARWYRERFGVTLDPATEILPLIGSKDGIAHLPFAFVNRGDVVLIPNPSYPPYRGSTILAEGEVCDLPLREENAFLPDLTKITPSLAKRAKILFLNYPNNPTGAIANPEFFDRVIKFAAKNNIIVAHDAAYTETAFDGYKPSSFLASEGARAVGIEFHSLSKIYNMTGWRIGFACGNADIIRALAKVKSNIDSGVFNAIQRAAIAALDGPKEFLDDMRSLYQERRDILVNGLNSIGWQVPMPKATFYVWAKVPKGYTSASFAELALDKANVVVTPGVGFGKHGEGYVRMALTVPRKRLEEAVNRFKALL